MKKRTGVSFDALPGGSDHEKPDWLRRAELVIEKKSGRVRQAGASDAEGEFVRKFKRRCEHSLYAFSDGVLNYHFLQPELHKPVCDWLTTFPPYRKMLLMPRNHGKSTLVGRSLPLHALIQHKDSNPYFPGQPGTNLRLVMAGEIESRVIDHIRIIKGALENNALLRALWPNVVWDNPNRQAGKWSDTELLVPRETNFPEPTIRGVGAGSAITGAHPNMIIKDDITTERAANEAPTMQRMIDWHDNTRALFANPDTDLEFITATYWAAYDLPNYIEKNDPTVEVNTQWRQLVHDGKVIFPKKYGFPGAVEQLMKESGVRFNFMYMNTVAGKDITDFMSSDLRDYALRGDSLYFTSDERDDSLQEVKDQPRGPKPEELRGQSLYTALNYENMGYLRSTRSL